MVTMLLKKKIDRRQFLKQAAVSAACTVGFPYFVPSSALGRDGAVAPSNRVALGSIGVGVKGRANTRGLMSFGAQMVAICDVDEKNRQKSLQEIKNHYAKKQAQYKDCTAYNDFRNLLARDDIDAVMIATPDHWHVPIAIAAVKAGKDIYVEKPLGMTIEEGQALREVVHQHKAVFMHGTEQRTMKQFRFACELIRNGRLGDLKTIKVAVPGGFATGVQKTMPIPEGFDYDMWLGPAQWKPYTWERCTGGAGGWGHGWYFISDYATSGFVAGWGVHHMDMAQWALNADNSGPVEIHGRGTFPKEGIFDTPLTWNIDFKYANGVNVNFTDNKQNKQGVLYEGTEGWIHVTRSSIDAHPKSLLKSVIGPNEIHLYKCDNDDKNFLDCVKSRSETAAPIEAAHRSTSVCYLGYISMLLGQKLQWNPQAERFVNNSNADRFLSRSMRSPWHL